MFALSGRRWIGVMYGTLACKLGLRRSAVRCVLQRPIQA